MSNYRKEDPEMNKIKDDNSGCNVEMRKWKVEQIKKAKHFLFHCPADLDDINSLVFGINVIS